MVSHSFATSWTIAHQTPLSMEFPRQEYSSGLPFPSPGDLPNPGIEPGSPALQADSLLSELPRKPGKRTGKTNNIKAHGMELTEKAMVTHSSTLAWKIPWMEEPGRLQSMGSLRVRHD